MSMIHYGRIQCDGCGLITEQFRAMRGDPGAAAMRRRLRQKGWRRVPRGPESSGRDYCGTCAAQHPEAK